MPRYARVTLFIFNLSDMSVFTSGSSVEDKDRLYLNQ